MCARASADTRLLSHGTKVYRCRLPERGRMTMTVAPGAELDALHGIYQFCKGPIRHPTFTVGGWYRIELDWSSSTERQRRTLASLAEGIRCPGFDVPLYNSFLDHVKYRYSPWRGTSAALPFFLAAAHSWALQHTLREFRRDLARYWRQSGCS